MSDNINSMSFKQLKNEVQSLRDELAIMKRKYEDIIYNLDDDNFSSRFVKEKGDMRTAIEINAEGIKTKVSNEEFESTKIQTAELISSEVKKLSDADGQLSTKIVQTAELISSEVKKLTDADTELSSKITQTADAIRSEVKSATETLDGKFDNYSTIEQTANKITSTVTAEYVDNLIGDTYVTNSVFQQKSDEIYAEVSSGYSALSSSISSVRQTANSISTRVGKVEDGEFNGYTLFTQTSDKFEFTGNVEIKSTDNSNNTLKMGSGHIELIPYDESNSIVDLGMYNINGTWEPRMRFGQGTGVGTNGTGWIYKTVNSFGMMYNTDSGDPLSIEFNSKLNAISIYGNVKFSGGTVSGLPTGGTGGYAVFG